MNETTKKRGGKREGAGRKKTTTKSIALRIPEDVAWIIEQSGLSITECVCNAVRMYGKEKGR